MCALQRRRGSGVVIRSRLFKPGSAASKVEWGHHEKYIKNKHLVGVSLLLAALAVAGGTNFLSGRSGSAQG